MAAVKELGGNGGGNTGDGPDNEYSRVSVVAAALIGTTVPSYVGQIGTDTGADQNYIAQRTNLDSVATLTHANWARI